MADNDAHCEALVREQDRDRYLATLFAPAHCRPALMAIHAFDLETSQIALRVHEPLAGEIRLQWWHDVIEGRSREQAAGNPVAAALLAARDSLKLPDTALLALIEARRRELEMLPFETWDDFCRYARGADGNVFELASGVLLGGRGDWPDGLFQAAGEAAASARLIRAFARFGMQGKVVVPLDILARHGLPPTDLLLGGDRPKLPAAIADWALRGLESLDRVRALLPATSQASWPAFLPLASVRPALSAVLQPNYRPDMPVPPAQWRRQLRLWWASRDLPRRL